jgi:RNase P subunit RPR2
LAIAAGKNHPLALELSHLLNRFGKNPPATTDGFLPMLFAHNGKAVDLVDYFCMEPLFDLCGTKDLTLMCSRQVGKTMTLSMRTLMNSLWTDHWKPLIVTPFFETTRRISTDYFASLIDQSPAKSLFYKTGCTKQVLERSLPNRSRIRFTYAHRNGDRARGIPANECVFDETQLMFPEVMAVVKATMNASPTGHITTTAGTPLTNANILSVRFKEESSRSHWSIKCGACGEWNIAAAEFHLMQMIATPPNPHDISRNRPAIRCHKCRGPLYPWEGQFVHLNGGKRHEHLGLHIPCVVMPDHCCNYDKWLDIWNGLSNPNVQDYTKYNEILGVPYDDGVALLTQLDLEKAACLGPNTVEHALKTVHLYDGRIVIGIDWGGRGMSGKSLTKIAVCGLASNGLIDILVGVQLPATSNSAKEAQVINHLCQMFNPKFIAHDNIGIGQRAEEMLVQSGIPLEKLLPMEYAGETQGVILKTRAINANNPRVVYNVDKTRGLLHLVEAYKGGHIRSFNFEKRYHAQELLLDMTHLRAETKVWVNSHKSETVLIQREPGQSDDFAHAVHHACNTLWTHYRAWPDLVVRTTILTPQDLSTYMVELGKNLDPETIEVLGAKVLGSEQPEHVAT